MATVNTAWGSYTALTVTNLQSLANDSTDPYTSWQSARIDLQSSVKPLDMEVVVDLSTAATSPANDQQAYLYVVPWMTTDGGTTWIPGGNFGTTTAPTGSEGPASISDPNSMRVVALPYKVTSQRLQIMVSVFALLGFVPDGVSFAIRNCTGAAFSTGCVVAYRTMTNTVA